MGRDLLQADGAYLAIAAMMIVTIATRVGGYWLLGRFPLTPMVRRGLESLPAAIFAASIVPLALRAGPAGWVGVFCVAGVMLFSRHEILALAAGLVAAAAVRMLGF
ncbi:AzlD domain-containing protein [Roseiarcaceae bacterium H3SJ34-1]|uniref:AzlD family protein n=1 Tax=Terripilifer ovatus TaxID=3032367 RepID=UPI003AB957AF|nr:AzlD domain-containing protein [Roseiarcaceae bacterium H3SJ34-1]